VSPYRPDLVDVWIFHVDAAGELAILMLRRAPERVLAGLWQGVSGALEGDERIVDGALRELREETGLRRTDLQAFYDLDQVNHFHVAPIDAVVSAAIFAGRVATRIDPRLSHEHDAFEWLPAAEAIRRCVWPGYRESIARIRDHLLDPALARWFELEPASPRAD
jgi:8-oxo-dGTP pyrophosphatase MutT (NUDIX family)